MALSRHSVLRRTCPLSEAKRTSRTVWLSACGWLRPAADCRIDWAGMSRRYHSPSPPLFDGNKTAIRGGHCRRSRSTTDTDRKACRKRMQGETNTELAPGRFKNLWRGSIPENYSVMCLVRLPGRRRQVRNHGHRTLNIAVHHPYLCQLHHHRCSLDKFSLCPSASDIL